MANRKRYYHSQRRSSHKRKLGSLKKGFYEKPRLDPQLKLTFSRIGIPEPTPFRPDPFQLEALDRIKEFNVLVSAPTGSGKTWIASQAISKYLSKGLKTWYASPLKALSNSIYQEFCHEFGSELCGILTGDLKVNPQAPIIVGTTEILRNQLYDAMHEGISIQADLVILDEAHYLSDPDRGVVWEEVLIYLPPRVRLLLLSATISNAEEICAWLKENGREQTWVVRSHERPVPLEMLFLFPDGLISPLAGKKGLVPKVKKFVASQSGSRRRRGSRKIDYGEIIRCLNRFDLLPAIFFLKSRMECDQALISSLSMKRPYEIRESIRREVKSFLKRYPHLKGHRQLAALLDFGIGSHHAGQLPYWKVLIEKMMSSGYLDAIFSTSTVAAGVNFPARTVVLIQSDRYDGHEFTNLTATDLHQMTGRAGRRGKDNIGFAMVIPGLYQDPQLIYELRDSPSEPLVSQIHINFSMTLNLLLSHTPREVKDLLDRSFASFQQKRPESMIQNQWDEMIRVLKRSIPEGKCDTSDPYEVLENIRKRPEMQKDVRDLARRIRNERRLDSHKEYLRSGRLFLHKDKGIYVLFHTYMEHGKFICAAHNIKKAVRTRKKKVRLRKVPFDKIRGLYDYRINLPSDYSLERLQDIFHSIDVDNLKILNLDNHENGDEEDGLEISKRRLKDLPCEDCEHLKDCHAVKNKELKKILSDFRSLGSQMNGTREGLWISFKRHVRFLQETRFVDEKNRLTPDGIWASKLRLDHPLLIAETIRKNGFSGVSPEVMAGCIGPFVWDRVQEVELKLEGRMNLEEMESAFDTILGSIEDMRRLKIKRGFDNPQILFWPAAALFLWARGVPWEKLLFLVPVDEGDMSSLIMRTADHLRQVTNLSETHPLLASTARTAIELIFREPVYIQ